MTTILAAVPSLFHLGWQQSPWRGTVTVWSQGTADTGGPEGHHGGRSMVSVCHLSGCYLTSDTEEMRKLKGNMKTKEI